MAVNALHAPLFPSLALAGFVAAGCGNGDAPRDIAVPAGKFTAGADCNARRVEPGCDGALSSPYNARHTVHLKAFTVDRDLVTDADYAECVQAGACPPQKDVFCTFNGGAYTEFAHALAAVDYRDARAYCRWRGKRLPTSYEFERIAQGTGARYVRHFAQWVDASGDGHPDGLLRGLNHIAFQAHRPEDFRDEDGVTRAFFRCAASAAEP